MADRQLINILFLCRGNSARSIFAECIMNREGGGRFKAYSAGSHPTGVIHDHTRDLLAALNYPTDTLRSKDWTEFTEEGAPQMDFAFTVCDRLANETCPTWPGQPLTAHWGVPDPVAATGNEAEIRLAFSEAYRMLQNRISIFVNLPLQSLDKLGLQKRLDEIGRKLPESA